MFDCNSAGSAGAPTRATAIDPWRHFTKDFKLSKCGVKSQRGNGMPYTNDDGSQENFKCPKCGAAAGIECDWILTKESIKCDCGWEPTDDELREIFRRDPEFIATECFNKYTRVKPSWKPRFETKTPMDGNEMRIKRHLRKCSA